jgi:hypothetical protein
MTQHIEITVNANPDADDCLAHAAAEYVSEHPELAGYDLSPRWADDDDREQVVLTVPGWAVADTYRIIRRGSTPWTDGVAAEDVLAELRAANNIAPGHIVVNERTGETADPDQFDDQFEDEDEE